MLHLPADGLSADGRRGVEADHPHLPGARAQPHPLPLLVPARGGLCGRRRAGLLLPGRDARRGPTRAQRSAKAGRWTSGCTTEADRIVNAYGNHPSFLLMAYGNEPAGRDAEFLALWNTYWRKRDPRRALHRRGGLAQDPREPVSQHLRAAHPAVGGRAQVAHQRAAAGDAHRLPRVHAGGGAPGRQPRDRAVVRLPQLCGDRQVHGRAQGQEL